MVNLIIPMAGAGKRFFDNGYCDYKPFIKIFDKPMLQYILDNATGYADKIFIVCTTAIKKQVPTSWLKKYKINIVEIDPHKLGPSYTLLMAEKYLPLNEIALISYVDIHWKWPQQFTKKELSHHNIVFTHFGHPHLIKNPNSAFCKIDSTGQLLDIQEKKPFTQNWLKEPLSIGAFSVKRLADLIEMIKKNVSANNSTFSEYYPTHAIKELLRRSSFRTIEVQDFVHWGTPEQLEDFISWNVWNKWKYEGQSVVYCSGKGSRMKQETTKKPFISLKTGELLFQKTIKSMKLIDPVIIMTNSDQKVASSLKNGTFKFIPKTKSQVESILKSEPYIDFTKSALLCSCDCFAHIDWSEVEKLKSRGSELIVFLFQRTLTQTKLSESHTSVLFDHDGKPSVLVKAPLPAKPSFGLAGFFWIKNPDKLIKTAKKISANITNTEPIVDHIISDIVEENRSKVSFVKLEKYFHLGSAEELLEYEYWASHALIH